MATPVVQMGFEGSALASRLSLPSLCLSQTRAHALAMKMGRRQPQSPVHATHRDKSRTSRDKNTYRTGRSIETMLPTDCGRSLRRAASDRVPDLYNMQRQSEPYVQAGSSVKCQWSYEVGRLSEDVRQTVMPVGYINSVGKSRKTARQALTIPKRRDKRLHRIASLA